MFEQAGNTTAVLVAPPVNKEDISTATAVDLSTTSVRFWRRLFLGVAVALALLFVIMGAVAVYQGLNDRAVTTARKAISLYEQGQRYYEEGRYELAAASFREALRLEPRFEAARQALAIAEAAAAGQPAEAVPSLPPVADPEEEWNAAVEAFNAGRFAEAADALERLRAAHPSFRPAELDPLLFQAHVQAGELAEANGDFEEAVRHFDQALALQPENDEVLQKRRLASAYRRGLEAAQEGDWILAAEAFRQVYLMDASYHDVATRLAEAHQRAGDEFFDRQIWCDAAEQYRAAEAVLSDQRVAERAAMAEARCAQQQAVLFSPPTTSEGETAPPADEAISPEEPVAGDTGGYDFIVYGEIESVVDQEGCIGHYIQGRILNEDGAPLPGITVVAKDEWGNMFTATSKENPAGAYDIPINAIPTTYQVYIVGSAGLPASPVLSVEHDESLASRGAACHLINWQRTHE